MKLILDMAQINTDFKLPRDKSARIWRYVDFAKFMSMLVRKGLFFSHNSDFVKPEMPSVRFELTTARSSASPQIIGRVLSQAELRRHS